MFYLARCGAQDACSRFRWGRGDVRFEQFLGGGLKIDIKEPIDKVRRGSGRFEDGRERRAKARVRLSVRPEHARGATRPERARGRTGTERNQGATELIAVGASCSVVEEIRIVR